MPAPYSPAGPAVEGDRELVGANAGAFTANTSAYAAAPTVNGANGYREGDANGTAGEGPERPAERYTEDRAGRRRLAEDYLRAKDAEQPPPSQAKFAATVGVAPATVSKAMKEWREDHGG